MVNYDGVCREVRCLMKNYNETDPFRLCDILGITVFFVPMGKGTSDCKGFFLVQSRVLTITINSDLPQALQRIICAHELGHAVLHRKRTSVAEFHEFELFDSVSQCEYEANIFAAEYLLKDEDVLEMLNDDLSFFQAAAQLYVPAELLDFKFRMLKWKGYKVIDAPLMANGNFLKKLEVPHEDTADVN